MDKLQTTLKSSFTIEGVGLHTGAKVSLTFEPADEDHGYKFQRTDLPGQPIIEALTDFVTDTSRGTTLSKDGADIHTVEHVLAALAGMEVDNVLLKVNGPEMPIVDGSSAPYVEKIMEVGIRDQTKVREYFEIPENIYYRDESNKVEMVAMPLNDYRLTVLVDYNSQVLGSQHASITKLKEFKDEIASCRTFCFLHELEFLLSQNLIKGGDLSNAIVIVDKEVEQEELDRLAVLFNKPSVSVKSEGILNNVDMRFQNEPARHKLLDLIGDLALSGVPIKAQIMAARPGHASNVAFAAKIREAWLQHKKENKNKLDIPEYNPASEAVFEHAEISRFLPHKWPFLLVDKIISLDSNEIIAIKNITGDQYFFQGHFPGEPLMPGVLQLEAMAQAGGVLVLHDKEDPDKWSTYFLKIESAKFKDKVVPGDTLLIRMKLVAPVRRGICMMKGEAYVGDRMVSEAEMTAQIIQNK
jgi:UDP-3-O-[3-hydroxymyristoyl] N-acetylglucosamine deacetylase/3-hydroxyacyl-[acyl-carrier-protein] dehydratase